MRGSERLEEGKDKKIKRVCPYCLEVQGAKIMKERGNYHFCDVVNAYVPFVPRDVKLKRTKDRTDKDVAMVSFAETQGSDDPMAGGPTRLRQ